MNSDKLCMKLRNKKILEVTCHKIVLNVENNRVLVEKKSMYFMLCKSLIILEDVDGPNANTCSYMWRWHEIFT